MSELRHDPIARRWVTIAMERTRRPGDFRFPSPVPADDQAPCDFCPGEEGGGSIADMDLRAGEERSEAIETQWQCNDGTVIDVLLSLAPVDPDDTREGVTFVAVEVAK